MAIKTGEDLGLSVVRGQLIVVKEVAAFFRVSVRWVNKHMADNTFPFSCEKVFLFQGVFYVR